MRLQRAPLTPDAVAALSPVMHDGFNMQGRTLYRVESEAVSGWVILQVMDGALVIVAFVGRGCIPLIRALREAARQNGLKRVCWLSFHRVARRVFRREFFARIEPTTIPGEFRYSILTGA